MSRIKSRWLVLCNFIYLFGECELEEEEDDESQRLYAVKIMRMDQVSFKEVDVKT